MSSSTKFENGFYRLRSLESNNVMATDKDYNVHFEPEDPSNPAQIWDVCFFNGMVSFRSCYMKYLCANNPFNTHDSPLDYKDIKANRSQCMGWESWIIEHRGRGFVFKSVWKTYLAAGKDATTSEESSKCCEFSLEKV